MILKKLKLYVRLVMLLRMVPLQCIWQRINKNNEQNQLENSQGRQNHQIVT